MSSHPDYTSIELWGIKISEPVTALTDFIVTAVCVWAYLKLKKDKNKTRILLYFRIFFLSMGAATFIGGIIGHAFLHTVDYAWKLPGWITSMISVAFLERISIERARPLMKKWVGYFFMRLNFIELISFIVITVITLNFYYVEIHAAYGMLIVVLSFEIYNLIKTKDLASKYIIACVATTTLAAILHIIKFSPSQWFNYFDIGHILLAISSYFVYKAAHLHEPAEKKINTINERKLKKELA